MAEDNKSIDYRKKLIYSKIAMSINSGNIRTSDSNTMEFDLRKSGDFTVEELDLVFGERPKEYYDMLNRLRKIKVGLIDENIDKDKESDEEIYKKVQAKKRQRELDDMLGYADGSKK